MLHHAPLLSSDPLLSTQPLVIPSSPPAADARPPYLDEGGMVGRAVRVVLVATGHSAAAKGSASVGGDDRLKRLCTKQGGSGIAVAAMAGGGRRVAAAVV